MTTSVPAVQLRLLGIPAVFVGSLPCRFNSKKSLLLLAYLALEQRSHPREKLAALLWSESSETTARAALRNALSELRAVLGEALTADRQAVRLDVSALNLDVRTLADSLLSPSVAALEVVGAFDSGELLLGAAPDDASDFEDWLNRERAVVRRHFGQALGLLAEARRTSGKLELAIAAAARRAALEPLSDIAQQPLLELLFSTGERDAAVRAYESYCALLKRELGATPERALQEFVREQLRSVATKAQTLSSQTVQSPEAENAALLPSLIGREEETQTVLAILGRSDVRLLTLCGPGGVGKTSLALQITERVRRQLGSCTYFVSLAALRDPNLVLPTVARELGLADEKGVAVELQIGAQLATRRCLIVLDNFEHLIEAATDLSRLLTAASGITLLVTSRSVLRLRGEHVYSLAPLLVLEAEQLFLARAGAAQLGFAPTEAEQQAIAEVCRRLDGLPLAIELAAARTRVLDPVALLARLDQRLNVLVEGPRDAPARQRTLRDTLLWSYELLSAEERRVFRALSVFVGGFFASAAEQVCATSLETLGSLCDQSLVSRSKDAQGRFYLLETIREFAFECLQQSGEREALEQRHLAYYVALAESSVARIHGSEQSQVLSELEAEHANLRLALQYATTSPERAQAALSLASLLTWYWHLRGHWSEGRSWLEKALTGPRLMPSTLRGRALYGLGMLECAQEDFELAKGHLDESLQLLSAEDGPRDRAHALGFRSVVGIYQRSFEGLEPLLDESLRLFEQCHDSWGVALTLLRSGIVSWAGGDAARAVALCTRSHAAFSSMGNDWGVAMSLCNLGESRLALGDTGGAVGAYLDSLLPLQRIRSNWYLALNASGLAGALAANGNAESGARLLASARASMASGKSALPPLDRYIYENSLRAVREALDESTFTAAWEEGERTALSDAVETVRRSLRF